MCEQPKYKYAVYLLDPVTKELAAVKRTVVFTAPLREGERVVLPADMDGKYDMPDWMKNEEMWKVEEITRMPVGIQPDPFYGVADRVVVSPA